VLFFEQCSTEINAVAFVVLLVDTGFVIAGQRQFLVPGILCAAGLLLQWCSR